MKDIIKENELNKEQVHKLKKQIEEASKNAAQTEPDYFKLKWEPVGAPSQSITPLLYNL